MSVELFFNNVRRMVNEGGSLFEHTQDPQLNIDIPSSCDGKGSCRECVVEVTEGMHLLSERTAEEEYLKDNYRLSCMSCIKGKYGTIRCSTLHRGSMQIFSKPGPADSIPVELDPYITRSGSKIIQNDIIIDENENTIYGIAADIGTTTVSLRLVNLETGLTKSEYSFENPQKIGGADVTSRVYFDSNYNSLLQKVLAAYITHAIEKFPVKTSDIYEMVVAGNPVMRDLFFRLDVHPLGVYPYQSLTELEMLNSESDFTSLYTTPEELNIPLNQHGSVYGMPLVRGHVGADAAASMLAVNIHNEDRLVAIMDIGTNTEIIIGNKNKIMAASCPAGPAFEGGRISCGMPALTGGIEKVRLNHNGAFSLDVIDNVNPGGICGSGLVSLLSELLKHNIINSLGRFNENIPAGILHREDRIMIYKDDINSVYITEHDINELAKAKGANSAGLYILFKNMGISFNDIDVFYLAGGFGNYIDIECAKTIGLIPDIDSSKFVPAGNASLDGAAIALLSKSKRNELEELVKSVIHCRLEADPEFLHFFTEGCQFKPLKNE
jgi:uncharacterized 2Fe-2S/4Fe-4S cluster protein (DUF4445 family)